MKDLARNLYDRRTKFGGFRRMFKKDVTSALTSSPVEGQIGEQRKVGVNASTQMHDSIRKLLRRANNNLDDRHAAAHEELASLNYFSRSPTSRHLIKRGEALVCRCHAARRFVKSARVSSCVWIAWNNESVDKKHPRHPLFLRITDILRVSRLVLTREADGSWFLRCTCGGRENLGVPCECFFKIAEDAGVPEEHIVHLCMITPKFLKLWQTHYATDHPISEALYAAQHQAFLDKDKGIRLTDIVAQYLVRTEATSDEDYPILGSNTLPSDYEEAMFMQDQSVCTASDVSEYRQQRHSGTSTSNSTVCTRRITRSRAALGDLLTTTDVETYGNLSFGAQAMQTSLDENELRSPQSRPPGHFHSKAEHDMYVQFSNQFDDSKRAFLESFNQITRHHGVDSQTMAEYSTLCLDTLTSCSENLRRRTRQLMTTSVDRDEADVPQNTLLFSGEETQTYISPTRNVRRKGPMG